ncbi:unnamed protein product [Rotaria sp. Silwood2]|nr:unnamed protein product [Rotaria sp. Silwood2]CAF4490267.1 unnamed protein product [Rotaria sp. Silwood2]CAF4539994.1 unnamed protein product [Rotaria sp. Silwood2]
MANKKKDFDPDSELNQAYKNAQHVHFQGIDMDSFIYKNVCPTQAILSVLFNCTHEDLNLGATLTEFKEYSQKFHPKGVGLFDTQMKCVALSSHGPIRDVHNCFAKKQLAEFYSDDEKKEEYAFHFIVYIPFKGYLYELDGLKTAPIDHGAFPEDNECLDVARPIVQQRIQKFIEDKTHFRLMVIVSEPGKKYERELKQILANSSLTDDERNAQKSNLSKLINEEKRKKAHRIANLRRQHNLAAASKQVIVLFLKQRKDDLLI